MPSAGTFATPFHIVMCRNCWLSEAGDRPHDGLAMGSALRAGTRGAHPTASETDQQILAGR